MHGIDVEHALLNHISSADYVDESDHLWFVYQTGRQAKRQQLWWRKQRFWCVQSLALIQCHHCYQESNGFSCRTIFNNYYLLKKERRFFNCYEEGWFYIILIFTSFILHNYALILIKLGLTYSIFHLLVVCLSILHLSCKIRLTTLSICNLPVCIKLYSYFFASEQILD